VLDDNISPNLHRRPSHSNTGESSTLFNDNLADFNIEEEEYYNGLTRKYCNRPNLADTLNNALDNPNYPNTLKDPSDPNRYLSTISFLILPQFLKNYKI
jgi:hypothetical protein